MGFYFGQARSQRKEFLEAYRTGAYEEAAALGEGLLEMHNENGETQTMEYAVDAHNLALVLDQLGFYDSAIPYYEKASQIKKDCKGETVSYADTLNNLGVVYCQRGQYEEARALFRKVLEVRDLKLGRCHKDYIYALYNLGNTYGEMGAFDQALELHQKALGHSQKCKNMQPLDLADLNGAVARCYDELGNYKKSISYYETTLDLIEKVRGISNYYYMVTILALAGVCEKSGVLSLAVEYCERAIEIRGRIMAEGQMDFVSNRNHLATICYKNGQFDRALELHQEILQRIETLFGHKNLFHASVLGSMAMDYLGKQALEKALFFAKQSYGEAQALMEEEGFQTAESMMILGAVTVAREEFDPALRWYFSALNQRVAKLGEVHGICGDTYCAISQCFAKQGAIEAALSCLRKALVIRCSLGLGQEEYILWILQTMAELCENQAGRGAAAVDFAHRAVAVAKEKWGTDHLKYALVLKKMSKSYEAAGDLEGAMVPLEESLAIQKEILDEDNPHYLETLEALAKLCFLKGAYARSAHLYCQRNDINFEETPEEQRVAAATLLSIANCYFKMGNTTKAEAYFTEAEGRLKRSRLPAHEIYEKERKLYSDLLEYGEDRSGHQKKSVLSMEEAAYLEVLYQGDLTGESSAFFRYLFAMAMGEIAEENECFQEAERWYQLAKTQGEDMAYVSACYRLGKLYLHTHQGQKAIRPLTNAKEYLEEYGDTNGVEYHEILGLLGDGLYESKHQEEALGIYIVWQQAKQARELPDTPLCQGRIEHMAHILVSLGRTGEAIEYYYLLATFVRKEKGDGMAYIDVLLKIAMLYLLRKELAQGAEVLDRILLLGGAFGIQSPYFARLSDTVGQLYAEAGFEQKAESALRWAYELGEDGNIGKKYITEEGLALLHRLLQKKGQEKAYFT